LIGGGAPPDEASGAGAVSGSGAPAGPRARADGRPRRRAGGDALVLGAALLAIAGIAALLGADEDGPPPDALAPRTVVVADVSASVTRMRGAAALWLARAIRAAAAEAVARGDEVAVVTVAAEATRRFGPSSDAAGLDELLRERLGAWAAGDDAAALSTDLDAGAALAVELLREGGRPPGTVVLVGDGVHTGAGDPEARLDDAAVARVELRTPRAPERHDLAVDAVRASPRVPADVPTRVAVDLALVGAAPAGATEVQLDWELRTTRTGAFAGRSGLRRGTARVPLDALEGLVRGGRATAELELPPLPEGSVDLVVTARLAAPGGSPAADAFAGDDRGGASWLVGDPVRVLVAAVGGASERAAQSLAGEELVGVDLVPLASPEEIEARLLAGVDVDVVLTLDVPLAQLPAEALTRFVRERGGGWIHSAGWSRLRGDAPDLAQLDPLEPDREPRAPRDVHFLVDGSGSMRGVRWRRAKEALARLVPALPPGDRLAVRTFTLLLGEPRLVFEASAPDEDVAARRARMDEALRDIARTEIPGGSTDIAGSLAELVARGAAETFRPAPDEAERERIVVLLTDGEETMGRGNGGRIRRLLTENDTRLVPLVVGDGSRGRSYLESFLPGGGRARVVGELDGVYAELQAAVEGTDPVAGARAISSAPVPAPPAMSRLRSAVQRAHPPGATVALELVLPCRPREREGAAPTPLLDAVVVEVAPDGDEETRPVGALVAAAEHGAGLTVGVALPLVDADGRAWAPELTRDPRWLAPIVREMAARRRAASDPGSGPTASIEERTDGARLVVRGLEGPAARRAELRADLVAPGGFDALGMPEPDRTIARVRLAPPRLAAEGAAVREAPRPAALDGVPRGTRLELRVRGGALPPLAVVADGSAELRALGGPPAIRPRAPADAEGPQAPAPALASPRHVPWLLAAGLLAVALGAVGRRSGP